MIVEFSKKTNDKMGNKAKFLMEMKNHGFNVPNGFVIDSDTYIEEIKNNKLETKIKNSLKKINKDNIEEISKEIIKYFDKFQFSDEVKTKIEKNLNSKKLYAVRSSGTKEDLDNFSVAGQYETFLNIKKENILENIINCYKSMFTTTILSYLVNNEIDLNDIKMSVIVQEMVDSKYSGICFTINPITGNDKQMLIEVGNGLGENIVSGQNKPEQYYYNWYEDKYEYDENNKLLNKKMLKTMTETFHNIMLYFGYPCDIEFAIENNELFILQARKITKIKYQGYDYLWTTADFKDGGVSASICYPYMWSLYEYIWEYTLKKFLIDSKILKEKEIPKKLGDMFYARCYWNMSAVKLAMSRVIGYKEREFDNEYGINPTYVGDGQTTKASLKSLIAILKMAIAQNKIVKTREQNKEILKSDLLEKYNDYKENYDNNAIKDIKQDWYKLTHDDYLKSESTYFWQIFINTIHQSLNKDSLLKHISEEEYLTLIGNIDDISHLLPFYEMWDASRKIRSDKNSKEFWTNTDIKTISKKIRQKNYNLPEILEIINKYGYHSDSELDVTVECYYEDNTTIISTIKDLIKLDDSFSPYKDQEKGHKKFKETLEKIKEKIGTKKYKKLEKKIKKIRTMLWWREEFRDVSTRFYYLIRIYTVKLSEFLVEEKVLKEKEDIWFLKVGQLWDFFDKKLTKKDLNTIIEKNKKYYNSYKNYMSENEIGSVFENNVKKATSEIKGLGANNGKITGTARVIKSFDEIDRLQENDILVTKFTDTGWTPKFAILSGIVTEYGGILCHAAIVSREYGIPCIVSCTDVMSKIKDGETITINGATGEVERKVK